MSVKKFKKKCKKKCKKIYRTLSPKERKKKAKKKEKKKQALYQRIEKVENDLAYQRSGSYEAQRMLKELKELQELYDKRYPEEEEKKWSSTLCGVSKDLLIIGGAKVLSTCIASEYMKLNVFGAREKKIMDEFDDKSLQRWIK